MNPFDLVERHHRTRLICHAIRHLLDHAPDSAASSDVEAIDILQRAIDPVADNSGACGQAVEQGASGEPVSTPEPAQLEHVLEYAG